MQKIAEASGTVVYDKNNVVFVARKPAQWTTTFLFVSVLLTFITCINGVVQLVLNRAHSSMWIPGLILIGIGFLFLGISIVVARYRKKINALAFDQLETICAFDLNAGKLLGSTGLALADLSQVNLRRKMQLTSSSRSLVLNFPGGSILLAKGSPFAGGVGAVEQALLGRGIK